MKKKVEMLRKKMSRFNAWEAENRRKLTLENRLKQFLALHELGQQFQEETRKRFQEEHLQGIINSNMRLRRAQRRMKS